jgi:hypothetical protein
MNQQKRALFMLNQSHWVRSNSSSKWIFKY